MKNVRYLLLVALTAAVFMAGTEAKVESKSAAKTVTVQTGLTAPVKVCSGVLNANWRDTITVPDTFTAEACKGFSQSIGTNMYQLGCLQPNSISWGGLNSGTPSPNCGW